MGNNTIELVITIILAVVGWLFAFLQTWKNRKLEKANRLADRRYEAYSDFLRKMDEISAEMNKMPQKIMGEMATSFLMSVLSDSEDPKQAVIAFNERLVSFLSDSLKPMSIMKQELSSLRLVASDEMLGYIQKVQTLTDDLYNDFYSCLSKVSPQDTDSFQNLKSIGQSQRVQDFSTLYHEMTDQMRKEIQLS